MYYFCVMLSFVVKLHHQGSALCAATLHLRIQNRNFLQLRFVIYATDIGLLGFVWCRMYSQPHCCLWCFCNKVWNTKNVKTVMNEK